MPDDIVFLDASTVTRGDMDFSRLKSLGSLTCHETSESDEIAGRLETATIAITNKAVISREVMEQCPRLKLIVAAATGMNHIDLDAAANHGVTVMNVAGYSTPSVAQHVIAFLTSIATSLHRFVPESQQWPESPIFTRLNHPVVDLAGRTLGILGLGDIGRATGRAAGALGMRVQALAREGSVPHPDIPRVSEEDFLASSDVISLHCPLTDQTTNWVNESRIKRMKDGVWIINTGRGPLIDEHALAAALQSGKVAAAGIDVLSTEPPSPDNPLLAVRHPHLLITPHTAWSSYESRVRLLAGIAENIESFQRDSV